MKEKIIIILILIVALGLRLLYINSILDNPPTSDAKDYNELALSLASGKGYVYPDSGPTSRRAPLPSAFFALVYMIFGYNITIARIAQVLVSTLTCFIIYILGKQIFTEKVGLTSATIAAIYPSFITFSGDLFSETLLIFLLVMSMYLFLKKDRILSMNSFLSGLCFGLAALTRPSVILLPLFIFFIVAFFKKETSKETSKKILIVTVAMFIVIMPWTIRNYCVHKKFVLVNTELGYILLSSYLYPDRGFGFQNAEVANRVTQGIDSEVERNKVLTRYIIGNIMKNPYKFIRLIPLKFLWFWEPFGGKDYGLRFSYDIIYGGVMLFFLFGLVGSRAMWKDLLPIYALIGYFILVSLVFYASRRFRMQVEPFIIILASYGVFWTVERWNKNRLIQMVLIIGLAANLSFLFLADNLKTFSKKVANLFGYHAFSENTVERKL